MRVDNFLNNLAELKVVKKQSSLRNESINSQGTDLFHSHTNEAILDKQSSITSYYDSDDYECEGACKKCCKKYKRKLNVKSLKSDHKE